MQDLNKMRTEQKWESIQGKYLIKFPPRIQRDLKQITQPKEMYPDGSLFIHGNIHTGKTILAAQLMMQEMKHIYLNALPDKHNKTLFVSFPAMLAEIKSTFSGAVSTDTVMQKYLGAHLLVIDDFITTRPTDWVMDLLYYLVNHRYEYLLKTIITCNYSLTALEELLQDQRITSRFNRSYTIIKKLPY